jgi:hypothetical protein
LAAAGSCAPTRAGETILKTASASSETLFDIDYLRGDCRGMMNDE